MRTRAVPHDEWKPFLSGFVSRHKGDSILVETVGGGAGPRSILCGSPLVDIAAEMESGHIAVTTGGAREFQTYNIGNPIHLSVSESDDGSALGLQITHKNGCITCLRVDSQDMNDVPPGYYLG